MLYIALTHLDEGDGRGQAVEASAVVMVACAECGVQWGFVRAVAEVTSGEVV